VIKVSAEDSIDTKSDKNSLRYLWDWGDNITSWGKFNSHLYQAYGYREITLHVIDDNGATDNFTYSIFVRPPLVTEEPNIQTNTDANYPNIAIGTIPPEVSEDEQVQFISEIELQEGNLTDYSSYWTFGDGTCSFEKAPLHAWSHAGSYDIELKVTDVNGWGIMHFQTDPTSSDTDHDFAIDSAELLNYKISLEDEYGKDIRVNLTEPVSLHFPQFFKKAATAQISFALSFGEQGSDENQTYGIDISSVLNLDVSITKTSDNIVLYNSKTNATRHFSQVV
ncbi:unnamed protein product, partial [marine sediment metagenome]